MALKIELSVKEAQAVASAIALVRWGTGKDKGHLLKRIEERLHRAIEQGEEK